MSSFDSSFLTQSCFCIAMGFGIDDNIIGRVSTRKRVVDDWLIVVVNDVSNREDDSKDSNTYCCNNFLIFGDWCHELS